ncbi:MAG: glutathione S-transferase family protein [Burkholderiales bacterium]|nr:glutathione S-transferase family protein [Burkholderiales bacterium]
MIDLYYLSGSPYAWRVLLALEHKKLQYKRIDLSFENGDFKSESYLALNPRGKVPVLVDEGVTLYESPAILEYLEDKYRDSGNNLLPKEVGERAISRRIINEIDVYLDSASRRLLMATFFTPKEKWNEEKISKAVESLICELKYFDDYFERSVANGTLSSVEFSMFPIIALVLRLEKLKSDLGFSQAMSNALRQWLSALEGLKLFQTTRPPHWK